MGGFLFCLVWERKHPAWSVDPTSFRMQTLATFVRDRCINHWTKFTDKSIIYSVNLEIFTGTLFHDFNIADIFHAIVLAVNTENIMLQWQVCDNCVCANNWLSPVTVNMSTMAGVYLKTLKFSDVLVNLHSNSIYYGRVHSRWPRQYSLHSRHSTS